jgi:hypothetical protein
MATAASAAGAGAPRSPASAAAPAGKAVVAHAAADVAGHATHAKHCCDAAATNSNLSSDPGATLTAAGPHVTSILQAVEQHSSPLPAGGCGLP